MAALRTRRSDNGQEPAYPNGNLVPVPEEDVKNRTSKGLVKEIEDIVYNLMSFGDHLLDLEGDDLIDALEHIEVANHIRQNLISTYAKEVDHRYHCAYKHSVKVLGLLKEAIIAATRNHNDEVRNELITSYEVFSRSASWVMVKYLKLEDVVDDPTDCSRCLDDLLLSKQTTVAKK